MQEGKHWILNGARRKRAKVVSYQAMQMTEEQLSSRHVAMQALEIELNEELDIWRSQRWEEKCWRWENNDVALISQEPVTPKNFKDARKVDAQNGDDGWEVAEQDEWSGLWKKEAFSDQKITTQKLHHMLWTYKIKSTGKKKARLCFDGRRQDPSTYDVIRSPTMSCGA